MGHSKRKKAESCWGGERGGAEHRRAFREKGGVLEMTTRTVWRGGKRQKDFHVYEEKTTKEEEEESFL